MNKGFTLIELIIVISIIGTLSMIGIGSYANVLKKSRDSKRVADMKDIRLALEQYKIDNGDLPNETIPGGSQSGWEVSTLDNFMEYLKPYIPSAITDPINSIKPGINMFFTPRPSDANLFYMYHYYNGVNTGSYYGCDFTGPFAVFGFRATESMPKDNLPQARCGTVPCAGGGTANVCRDWSNEFDYSVIIRQ